MRKVVHKLFFIWDFELEEQWLNEMSAMGYNLVSVGFARFEFEQGIPYEYIYRIEMLPHFPSHPESMSYIRFIEETGAEQIGSLKSWIYFRKKSSDGNFDMYSDIDSRIKHIDRIIKLAFISFMLILTGMLMLSFNLVNMSRHIEASAALANMGVPMLIQLFFAVFIARGFFKLRLKRNSMLKERALRE